MHVVFHHADAGFVAFLAVFAAGNFHFVQNDFSHFRTEILGAGKSIIQKSIAVAADPRTSHNTENFHFNPPAF
jgi:hypothetical protein